MWLYEYPYILPLSEVDAVLLYIWNIVNIKVARSKSVGINNFNFVAVNELPSAAADVY